MRFLSVEIRRQLHRRSVWWLLAVAALGIALLAAIGFITGDDESIAARIGKGDAHPAIMQYWWRQGGQDGMLLMGMLFLFMGAVIGGATATGGEWRNGTIPALLTWEPRRIKFALARLGACAICAAAIGLALQVAFMLAMLPTVAVHGTTDEVDAAYLLTLAAAVGRASIVASLAATLAASLALAFRNTAAALGAMWVWLSVLENVIRGVKPWMSRYLVTDNVARFVAWFDMGARDTQQSVRSPAVAGLLLLLYISATLMLVVRSFVRSDAVAA